MTILSTLKEKFKSEKRKKQELVNKCNCVINEIERSIPEKVNSQKDLLSMAILTNNINTIFKEFDINIFVENINDSQKANLCTKILKSLKELKDFKKNQYGKTKEFFLETDLSETTVNDCIKFIEQDSEITFTVVKRFTTFIDILLKGGIHDNK